MTGVKFPPDACRASRKGAAAKHEVNGDVTRYSIPGFFGSPAPIY